MARLYRKPTYRHFNDLEGRRFGKLLVVAFRGMRKGGGMWRRPYWLCKCDCGGTMTIHAHSLVSGDRKSCGCDWRKGRPVDLVGRRYGRLTVVADAGRRGKYMVRSWHCVCDCGNTLIVNSNRLYSGQTQSCSCLRREHCADRLRTHGMCGTKEHKTWLNVRRRCLDPNCPAYREYGAKGITVCNGLAGKFEDFYAVLGDAPSPHHSIDRADGTKGYTCGKCDHCKENGWQLNVRWLTPAEQNRNKKNNRLFTLNGETMCLEDWAKRIGISPGGLHRRKEEGWSDEEALTTPKGMRRGVYSLK